MKANTKTSDLLATARTMRKRSTNCSCCETNEWSSDSLKSAINFLLGTKNSEQNIDTCFNAGTEKSKYQHCIELSGSARVEGEALTTAMGLRT